MSSLYYPSFNACSKAAAIGEGYAGRGNNNQTHIAKLNRSMNQKNPETRAQQVKSRSYIHISKSQFYHGLTPKIYSTGDLVLDTDVPVRLGHVAANLLSNRLLVLNIAIDTIVQVD
jgi:hypothetical protein